MRPDPKPRKVRSDVVLRRFSAGMTVFAVAYRFGLEPLEVEAMIRRRLNQPSKRSVRPAVHNLRQCESELIVQYPSHAQARNGERWSCSCGRVFVHVCDEAEGCWWSVLVKRPRRRRPR
jgi:hypothetical protein